MAVGLRCLKLLASDFTRTLRWSTATAVKNIAVESQAPVSGVTARFQTQIFLVYSTAIDDFGDFNLFGELQLCQSGVNILKSIGTALSQSPRDHPILLKPLSAISSVSLLYVVQRASFP